MPQPVLLALQDLSPALAVEVLPKGLVVNRFLVNADGKTHDLVVGPNDPAHHGTRPHKYQNTVIGRYTNRIPVRSLEIEKNGAKATLKPIPNENPKSSLHGGAEGFDTRDWEPIDVAAATLFSDKEKASIASLPSSAIFKLISPDGDQGYPGKLLVEVLFAVSPGASKPNGASEAHHVGSLYIVYRAKLLSESKEVTPVNLTQHWGFNLEASLAGKGKATPDIKEHNLFIKADHTIDLDEHALSTGKLNPTAGTPQEHAYTRLGDSFPPSGHGINSFYVFKASPTPIESIRIPLSTLPAIDLVKDILQAPARTNPLVELSSERSGWTLAFDSNQPGVQFYSANFFEGKGTRKPIHGWSGQDGDGYGPQTFAFLEFHEPLAAWLHPETAVSGDTLLTSDELYNNFVRVDVLFKQPPGGEAEE